MNSRRQKILVNFKKSRSHVESIIKMIEEERYCVDIMQQNLAVIGLLRSAHQMLMENHLNTCFKEAIDSKDKKKKQAMTEEILQVTKLFNK
ncbi:metal-sensing transcriptional repressor [Patescibacteria group bacterium]|nr:metal-sensing transcriptional repressor [Patescibacteria group bacterium]